jgi:hypothetical protein
MAFFIKKNQADGSEKVFELGKDPVFINLDRQGSDQFSGQLKDTSVSVLGHIPDYAGKCLFYAVTEKSQITINGESVFCAVLNEGDRMRIGSEVFLFTELAPTTVQKAENDSGEQCPFCHGNINAGDQFVKCPRESCGSKHHLEHWIQYGNKCSECNFQALITEDGGKENA